MCFCFVFFHQMNTLRNLICCNSLMTLDQVWANYEACTMRPIKLLVACKIFFQSLKWAKYHVASKTLTLLWLCLVSFSIDTKACFLTIPWYIFPPMGWVTETFHPSAAAAVLRPPWSNFTTRSGPFGQNVCPHLLWTSTADVHLRPLCASWGSARGRGHDISCT